MKRALDEVKEAWISKVIVRLIIVEMGTKVELH